MNKPIPQSSSQSLHKYSYMCDNYDGLRLSALWEIKMLTAFISAAVVLAIVYKGSVGDNSEYPGFFACLLGIH